MFITSASAENALAIFRKSIDKNIPAVFPTDTIYGIGAPISAIEANKSIFSIKSRPEGFPFPILAGSFEQVKSIAITEDLSQDALTYISKWPGPYTFIFKAKKELNEIYKKNNTVAIRIPNLEWLKQALISLGEPVTATSVNMNKEVPINNLDDIVAQFGDKVSLFIKGVSEVGRSSEIYDISGIKITKLR